MKTHEPLGECLFCLFLLLLIVAVIYAVCVEWGL